MKRRASICITRAAVTSRTAVYGAVRTVVWEGRSREASPYPDLSPIAYMTKDADIGSLSGKERHCPHSPIRWRVLLG